MRALTKRSGIIAAFAIMFVLLVVNAMTLRRELFEQLDSQRWVWHTHDVLYELSQTESLIKDAERGQRGYLYTADRQYLEPYLLALRSIPSHLDQLGTLISDNPQEVERVSKLRLLIGQKLAELNDTLSLFDAGQKDAAKKLVQSNESKHRMEAVQGLMKEMRSEELRLEKQRSSLYERDVRNTLRSLYIATGIRLLALILLALYVLHEMAVRQSQAQQLLEREEWFRSTLTSLGDAVIATDAQGCITYLNPLAQQIIGVDASDANGHHIDEIFPIFNEITMAPAENPIEKVMEHGIIVGLANHTVLRNRAGELIPIEDSASPIRDLKGKLIGAVLVFRDATQERKTQALLRESEKLTAAARMSATVAHEVNNPLESVGNLIYLAKNTPDMPAVAYDHLILAERELERVAHITKQTLGFYREFRQPEIIDLPSLLEYVIQLCSNKITTKKITVHRDFSPCPSTYGVPGELKQVFSNLIQNAADAVNEGGNIWIAIFCTEAAHMTTVCVQVRDDGPGIPEGSSKRIFDAFYTTKKNIGNGLGLWVSKEIIERHRGKIVLQSRHDASNYGASFQVFLPEFIPQEHS